jgi:phosphinothricin acetyltransferase
MTEADAPEVLAIYGEGIATGHATFQDRLPSWAEWDRGHLPHCRLVAAGPQGISGFAALSPVSARAVYRGVAEVSVYVAEAARGRRVGRALLAALVEAAEEHGVWTLQAGIFPENEASLALHRACGFREVGRRERLGRMVHGPFTGRWRDVVLLERRSPVAGSD